MKAESIKINGYYFKHFHNDDGIAQPVTVLDLKGDEVTIVRGHIPRYEPTDTMPLMKCWANQLIPPSPKVKERYSKWLVRRLKETVSAVEFLLIEKKEGTK